MKSEIHPKNYRPVIFQDAQSKAQFLVGSTVKTEEKGTYEGKEYDLYRIEISSDTHPFYTGKETVLDTAGRVDRFKKRVEAAKSAKK